MIEVLLVIIVLILLGPWILPLLFGLILLAASPFIFLFVLIFGKVDVKRVKITRTKTKQKEPVAPARPPTAPSKPARYSEPPGPPPRCHPHDQ